MNRTTRKPRPQKSVSDTCPKCGYCDKCGRSNAAPVWPYPVTIPVPYVTPTNTWPFRPYVPYTTQWPIGTISVSGAPSAAAQPAYIPSTYNISGLKPVDDYGLRVNTSYGTVIDPANTISN